MKKLLALCALSLGLALQIQAAVPPAEKLLPSDTLIVFTIPDFTKWREIYHTSPVGRFWNDPSMKPFSDKFMDHLQSEFLTPLEHDLGAHFSDYTNFFQGQLTVAMVQDGWQGKDKETNQPGIIILLDTRDKGPQLKSALADLKKKWVDAGKTARTEKIRDVDFSLVMISSNDVPKSLKPKPVTSPDAPEPMPDPDAKNPQKQPLYVGQADSLLIIGNSSRAIEKVLAAMSGGGVSTLGEQANFSSAAGMLRDSTSFGWVNVKAFVDIFLHHNDGADESPNAFGLDPSKIVSALGVNGLKNIAFNYRFTPEGAQFNLMLGIPESERAGLFKILVGEAKDYNPPAFVPADVVKFQRWRISGQKTWDTLHQIIADASPANAGGVDIMLNSAEAAAKDKDPNFDIHKNLIGNLGDDFISYQKNPKSSTFEDLGSAPSIVLIGSPNPEQLVNAFKLVSASFTQPPTEREFLGHKICTIQTGTSRAADGKATVHNTFSYTCNSGYVALSSDAGMLEEFLRSSGGDTKSLKDTPGLADAAQKVGGPGTSLFGYSNESENMRVFLEALKNSPAGTDPFSKLVTLAMMSGVSTGGQPKLSDWIDVSLLPPYSAVSKYFYFSVYAGQATPDGLYFKAFAPVPPGFK